MIDAALVAGQQEDTKFPGRNTFPLLGRPMMVYPILAAQHAEEVDRVFLTTDSPAIERVAAGMGVTTLSRSLEVSGPSVRLTDVVVEAAEQAAKAVGETPEAIVLLLCNAPTVTGGLIDHGVEILRKDPSLDAVMSVSLHNEFHPSYALRMGEGGRLCPYTADREALKKKDEAYFPDACGQPCHKRDSFVRARPYFSDHAWSIIDRASEVRRTWPLKEGVLFTGNAIPQ